MPLSKVSCPYRCVGLFLFRWSICQSLSQYHIVLISIVLQFLKSSDINPPRLFFFYKDFCFWGFLFCFLFLLFYVLCVSIWNSESICLFLQKKKKASWAFDWGDIKTINQFRKNWHLTNIKSLDSWTHYISPFICIFFNFSQQRFYGFWCTENCKHFSVSDCQEYDQFPFQDWQAKGTRGLGFLQQHNAGTIKRKR